MAINFEGCSKLNVHLDIYSLKGCYAHKVWPVALKPDNPECMVCSLRGFKAQHFLCITLRADIKNPECMVSILEGC